MKNNTTLFLVLLLTTLIGCSVENDENDLNDQYQNLMINIGGDNTQDTIILYQDNLIAGQNIDVGTILVSSVNGIVVVKYETEGDWQIDETHLFIGPLSDLPTNNGGNPKIGQFPFKDQHNPGTVSVVYNGPTLLEGECLYVAAHAVVSNVSTGDEETAWGAGIPIGGNSWAMMFEICN